MHIHDDIKKGEVRAVKGSTNNRLYTLIKSIVGLLDFVICIFVVALFFQGTIPGGSQLREGLREVYSYMLDPKNLVITVIIVVRLSIYGISKALKS